MAHLVPLITIRRWIRVVKHAEFVHKEVFCFVLKSRGEDERGQNNGILLLRLAGDVNLRRGTIAYHQICTILLCSINKNQLSFVIN
jgi:hypothetical protein